MADTVETAAPSSPADQAEKPHDAVAPEQLGEPQEAAPPDQPEEAHDAAPADEADEPQEGATADEAEEAEDTRSIPELLDQLSSELTDLGKSEAQLEAARNMPEVRRSARDIAGALIIVLAALTAFAFLNVAAMDGLSKELAPWLAAFVIAAVWTGVALLLLFSLMGRARRWLLWIVVKEPPKRAIEELEQERNAARKAARSTLERLGPALAIQIALAAVPHADDVASGVVEVGDSMLDASDEIVAEFTEEMPGGGAVRQVWAVALAPGRFGVRVATTVLRRGRSNSERSPQ